MDKDELISTLIKFDEEASMILSDKYDYDITIVGGSALVLLDSLKEKTKDIDVIGQYNLLDSLMNKYDMNSNVNAFCDCLPYEYESRLIKLNIPTKIINFYILSLEDEVIMKLFSSRGRDYEDITNINVLSRLDWDKLINIVESGEVDNSFNQRQYSYFLSRYEKYVKDYRKWESSHF